MGSLFKGPEAPDTKGIDKRNAEIKARNSELDVKNKRSADRISKRKFAKRGRQSLITNRGGAQGLPESLG